MGSIPSAVHQNEGCKPLPDKGHLMMYLAPIRKISFDGFIVYENRFYGVPYSYAGKTARVMRLDEDLYILDSNTYEILTLHHVDWSKNMAYMRRAVARG